MACLANTVQSNPDSFYFALAGSEGPGSSLQSPATVLPGPDGNSIINVRPAPADLGDTGLINVGSQTAGQNGVINIQNGSSTPGAGFSLLTFGNGSLGAQFAVDGDSSTLNIEDKVAGNSYLSVDTVANNVSIGGSSAIVGVADGTVTVNQALVVRDSGGGLVNGLGLSPTSPTASVISQTLASGGTLNLGSSLAAADTLALVDTGANSAYALLGGNGGANIFMVGGNGDGILPNIRTDAGNAGTLTLGSSVANPLTVYVRDGLTAGTGFVDITGGISNSVAMRLQGANATSGANNATISTNLSTGNSAAQLNLSSAYNDPTPAVQITSSVVKINRPITGNTVVQTITVGPLNDGGSAAIPSSGSPSITEGLWAIVANNTAQDNQIGTQVSCVGYFSDGTSPGEWICGGNGFGQALTNPTRNFAIQPTLGYQTLTFLNTSGFNMASGVKVYFIRITGALGL